MKGNKPMNKTAQRIVSGLLVLLAVIGTLPTVFATGTGLEKTPTEPTEKNESTDTTEPTGYPDTGDPDIADTPPDSDMEEEVTASRVFIGGEDAPMLFDTRAAIRGTHYQRAIIWLNSGDSQLNFTYNSKNYSVNRLYVHGVIYNGSRYVAYCVDPGVLTTESSGGYSGSETAWSDLDIDTQTAVGLAVLYGAPNGLSSSDKKTMLTYEFATQIVIHEIILGYRSKLPPYACSNESIIKKFGANADGTTDNSYRREITSGSADYSSLHGQYIDRCVLRQAYDQIAANMASHYVLPSFASRYNAAARTYEMTKQNNGTYSVTLTDSNNVLSKCTFQNGNGLTYSVNGNKLTVSSSGPFDGVKSCALSSSGGVSKDVPNLANETFLLWQSGSYQRLITLMEPQNDPLPICFNVSAPVANGTAQIIKQATNGGSVSGWHFTVKNASGTKIGDYVTDATGVISIELEPGTYTVTETDAAAKYWVNDPTVTKSITVKAGETTSVTFTNQWKGQAQIVKTTTNGGKLDGWHFTIKDASGNKIGDYVTDSTGIITLDLEPGTYTVTETDAQAKYWVNDATPTKTVTVKAGETAKVTFKNQYHGQAQIIKTLLNPEAGTLEGWTFTITDSGGKKVGTYQTDSTGVITVDLEPGTYTVTEVLEDSSLWQCTTANSQTIKVTAGKTAKVTFTNALRPGTLQIRKVDTHGTPLAGVEFLLEWSKDGENWQSVSFTESSVPQIGGCTTVGLTNGKLKSDSGGVVVFSCLHPLVQYRLTETATVNGYQLLKGYAYEGSLPLEDDLTISLQVVNAEVFHLPNTGAKSIVLMPIAPVLCLATCAGALLWLRKKEGR
ncbi:MAG: SpaA isopeptide-forming pilin-related protein [Faecousia sp.]